MQAKILMVDDEPSIVELISFNLTQAGYQVVTAKTGPEALEKAAKINPDLIVLDIMLPHLDGFDVCRQLRKSSVVPILMLTAKNEEIDKILGLELGADDYLTKPFSPRELLARIKALLRRISYYHREETLDGEVVDLKRGELVLSINKHQVTKNGALVELTLTEFGLLKLLVTNPGQVFNRDFLLNRIWGEDFFGDARTIDVHIRHLREKVEDDPAKPRYILTVRGVGYKFNEQEGRADV
ncbi:MAG: response regulator transcription factor [Clostridia bacterium]|jgi:two-component system OmpR family response regulator/two-component system alkaline phosphatase synthesis response regulator PhoP|nr:response regulator transcription factor [Clostridia bacterium]